MATTITGTTIDVGPNKLVANSAGNVGIGTASPAKPLDVTGDIRTSTGILFGTDTAAANALDDYEEGNFLPTIGGGTTAGTPTYDDRKLLILRQEDSPVYWVLTQAQFILD